MRWQTMNNRCSYPGMPGYSDYGGRGIRVGNEWNKTNPEGFKNFKAWMISQGYDETLPRGVQTIDRIDVNGDYCPDNCRLISMFEQAANTRKNVYITYNGETHHVSEWARITGMSKAGITRRFKSGMSAEEIFNKPLKPTNNHYEFDYEGKHYTTLTEVANDYSLDMKYMSLLINRKGYSVIEAIEYLRMRLQENLSTEAPTSMPKKRSV